MAEALAGISGQLIPVVILVFSLIGVAVIIERFLTLYRRNRVLRGDARLRILQAIDSGDFSEVTRMSQKTGERYPAIALVAALAQQNANRLETYAEELGRRKVAGFDRYMSTLNVVATVSPLLGLLGTVTGMIQSFAAFSAGTEQQTMLMGGVDEALLTTAMGLAVAIPALIAHNYFAKRIQLLTEQMNLLVNAALPFLSAGNNSVPPGNGEVTQPPDDGRPSVANPKVGSGLG